jgi:uncharacterized membrane protein YphA (DoxX/SURF4 family)
MKLLRLISRILVGIVFVFSGFVKAIDPLGSTYKFGDYFNAFGMGFLEPLAFPLAMILSSAELLIGISLLLAYRMKVFSWLLLVFMAFFTILTFILALTNPVTDCGCFGDALIMTNWETFGKNLILMAFTLIIFLNRNKFPEIRSGKLEWSVLTFFLLGSIFLNIYCYKNLPLLDFRPYSIGTNIPDAMTIPEDAPESEYETRLYYKNLETGEVEEFTMEDFPRDTTLWEFEDAVTILISEGYEPPIHDFNIMAPDGSEITDDITSFEGYSFMIVSYDITKANPEGLKKANEYFQLAQATPDIQFHAVSSSLREDLDRLRTEFNLVYDISQADEITLKTIVRSNPGLLLIKNGTIVGKWHYNNFPEHDYFPEYESVIENYPFCVGCDLKRIQESPIGSRSDVYETVLYYRNMETDSIHEFSIDNFPVSTDEWEFVNSVSEKVSSGFSSPVSEIEIKSVYGIEVSDMALSPEEYSLLFFVKDPSALPGESMQNLIEFGGMAGQYIQGRTDIFAITALDEESIINFTEQTITPFEFYMAEEEMISDYAGDSVRIVLLRNGKVVYNYSGMNIPDASVLGELEEKELQAAESVIKPVLLTDMRMTSEKRLVYIFIFGFLLLSMIIRVVFNSVNRNV